MPGSTGLAVLPVSPPVLLPLKNSIVQYRNLDLAELTFYFRFTGTTAATSGHEIEHGDGGSARGDHACVDHGRVDLRCGRMRGCVLWPLLDQGDHTVAAPPTLGRRSDGTAAAGGECEEHYGGTVLGRGRRRARRPRWTASSPATQRARRRVAGRSRATVRCSAAGGDWRGRNERRRLSRAAPVDSFGGKGEDDEAEPTVASNRAGAAGVDGGVLGSHGGDGEQQGSI